MAATLLQRLKTVLDNCKAAHSSVPTYYYSENPESTQYPKLDIEKHSETPSPLSLNDSGPSSYKGEFTLVLVGEAPIGPLEDIMGIIFTFLTPSSFNTSGSGALQGDSVLTPGKYSTEQLADRSFNQKQLIKLKQEYTLLFGGSF